MQSVLGSSSPSRVAGNGHPRLDRSESSKGRRNLLPDPSVPEEEFREHVGFLGIMLCCAACAVYLMGQLRPIVRPLLWALFLVMGLQPAVVFIERFILCCAAGMCRCCSAVVYRCCCHRAPRDARRISLVESRADGPPGQEDGDVQLGLRARPSIIGSVVGESSSASSSDVMDSLPAGLVAEDEAWGYCPRVIAKSLAIMLVTILVLCAIGGFVIMLINSFVKLKLEYYKNGAERIRKAMIRIAQKAAKDLPANYADDLPNQVYEKMREFVQYFVPEAVSNGFQLIVEILMMILYIVFWLSDPVPVGSAMEELFRRYIILKGLACLGYGCCVGALLHVLKVDLAEVFGLMAFLLSFIPEVGAFLAIVLPVPLIALDVRHEKPLLTLLGATAGQLALKFVFANVVEVKLVEADKLMRMHPVVILIVVAFFGYIWGPTGMLLSVPLVAYIKVVVLSHSVPSCYRNPVLVLLEGDRQAPARYAEMAALKANTPTSTPGRRSQKDSSSALSPRAGTLRSAAASPSSLAEGARLPWPAPASACDFQDGSQPTGLEQ